jgi:hypothetical protein
VSSGERPGVEKRRASDFERELLDRAADWIPSWHAGEEKDFGRALLKIAARFNSEVAERLDRAGEKMQRGFFDWLGVRGLAANAARMPVAFKMGPKSAPVLASEGTRMLAEAEGNSVSFETETAVWLLPSRLAVVVAADAGEDKYFLQPPGLTDLEPSPPGPAEWRLKSFASAGASLLQLDPALGLAKETIIKAGAHEYRITKVEGDIVTIEPALAEDLAEGIVRKVASFDPFAASAINRQEHALYLGHSELLKIDAKATIEVVGTAAFGAAVEWQYWGKVDGSEEVKWQDLPLAEHQSSSDATVLEKPKGTIEEKEIKGKNSRWIRAFTRSITDKEVLARVDELALRVNPAEGFECFSPQAGLSPFHEAMANTTPLVLNSTFFPLGKDPKQFDAFYLSSPEAFSKPGAEVHLCFEMGDLSCRVPTVIKVGAFADKVIAGVGRDGALHLLEFVAADGRISKLFDRDGLRPPSPAFDGKPEEGDPALDEDPEYRLPMWPTADTSNPTAQGFRIAMKARNSVWAWHEHSTDPLKSGWESLGLLPQTNGPETSSGLVYLDGASPKLLALHHEKLFACGFGGTPTWDAKPTKEGPNFIFLVSITPIFSISADGSLTTDVVKGMIGVDRNGEVYRVSSEGDCVKQALGVVDLHVAPFAVLSGSDLLIAMAKTDELSFSVSGAPDQVVKLEGGERVLGIDAFVETDGPCFVASIGGVARHRIVTWKFPYSEDLKSEVFESNAPYRFTGAPSEIAGHIVVPGDGSDLLVLNSARRRRLHAAKIGGMLVVPALSTVLQVGDTFTSASDGLHAIGKIVEPATAKNEQRYYPLDGNFAVGHGGIVLGFHTSRTPYKGDTDNANSSLILDVDDKDAIEGGLVLIGGVFYEIVDVQSGEAKLSKAPPDGTKTPYYSSFPVDGRVQPFLDLSGANSEWDATLLDDALLKFPTATRSEQKGVALNVTALNFPTRIVLSENWSVSPTADVFFLDASFGQWTRLLGDSSTNPELSWEYWNGSGWWNLDVTDTTSNLKSRGDVKFPIPVDIKETDWAGKTSFWIRARLIGGDYGQEQVTVEVTTVKPGVTKQAIKRSLDGIRPPAVTRLQIAYQVAKNVLPTFVLAEDSGSIRDQSDANRTPGAIVEGLVPLSVSLGRLTASRDQDSPSPDASSECECDHDHATPATGVSPASTSAANPTDAHVTGRSLLLGFDGPVSDDSVRIFFRPEREGDVKVAFEALVVEALVGDRFMPLVANDETHCLSETGILTLALPEPTTPSEMFGGPPRHWIRLYPLHSSQTWRPNLAGAYANAVWASAMESMTRELLGSSEGAPDLRLKLARPPVLAGSLELRVQEPLGEEQREALTAIDKNRVLSDDPTLSGHWVLWDQVVDPLDHDPTARVYSLDEQTGEVVFGDGKHGAIPPVGRGSIVAFRYRQATPTLPDAIKAPANSVSRGAKLNLVTPVSGAEAVFAVDQAAGGAPPERVDRILRFASARLRHRGRVVTSKDLEDFTLQSFPDVAQAHAMVRGQKNRLVVVMRGSDLQPRSAQKREIKRRVLSVAPPTLTADALEICGPKVRNLQVRLKLRVASLDHAGAVSESVKRSLGEFFDAAAGDSSKRGWPLGESPREEDIAAALIDIPNLLGIAEVKLLEVRDDEGALDWPESIAPDHIAQLALDAVRLEYQAMGAVA